MPAERRLVPSTGSQSRTLLQATDRPLERVEATVGGAETSAGVLKHRSQISTLSDLNLLPSVS